MHSMETRRFAALRQFSNSRGNFRLRLLTVVMAGLIGVTAVPAGAASEEPVTGDKGSDMLVDLIVMRPLGLASTVVGAAVFVVALPFTLPTGSVKTSAHEMVVRPAEYTFNRPLGELNRCGSDRHPCGGP